MIVVIIIPQAFDSKAIVTEQFYQFQMFVLDGELYYENSYCFEHYNEVISVVTYGGITISYIPFHPSDTAWSSTLAHLLPLGSLLDQTAV